MSNTKCFCQKKNLKDGAFYSGHSKCQRDKKFSTFFTAGKNIFLLRLLSADCWQLFTGARPHTSNKRPLYVMKYCLWHQKWPQSDTNNTISTNITRQRDPKQNNTSAVGKTWIPYSDSLLVWTGSRSSLVPKCPYWCLVLRNTAKTERRHRITYPVAFTLVATPSAVSDQHLSTNDALNIHS